MTNRMTEFLTDWPANADGAEEIPAQPQPITPGESWSETVIHAHGTHQSSDGSITSVDVALEAFHGEFNPVLAIRGTGDSLSDANSASHEVRLTIHSAGAAIALVQALLGLFGNVTAAKILSAIKPEGAEAPPPTDDDDEDEGDEWKLGATV